MKSLPIPIPMAFSMLENLFVHFDEKYQIFFLCAAIHFVIASIECELEIRKFLSKLTVCIHSSEIGHLNENIYVFERNAMTVSVLLDFDQPSMDMHHMKAEKTDEDGRVKTLFRIVTSQFSSQDIIHTYITYVYLMANAIK